MAGNCFGDILSISVGDRDRFGDSKEKARSNRFPLIFLIELWGSETLAEKQTQRRQQLGGNKNDLNAIFKCQNSACSQIT